MLYNVAVKGLTIYAGGVTDLRVEYARGQNRQGSVIAVAWVPKSKVSKDIDAWRLSLAA